MKRRALLIAWFSIACVAPLAAQPPPAARANVPEANPHTSESDLATGRKLYEGRCAQCHGQRGEGGRGSVLNRGRFRRAESDRDLFRIVRFGIPGTEMPGVFPVPEREVWQLVAYVRQLGRQGATDEPVSGNAALGASVYEKNGCAACHTIAGKGGFLGPDLTDVGALRAVRYLRESIVDPSADVPLDYRTVSVTTRARKTIQGIHLNEDEYSIHLQDMEGELRSFLKSELTGVELPARSLMPAYDKLPAADLEGLVAYLTTLRRRAEAR